MTVFQSTYNTPSPINQHSVQTSDNFCDFLAPFSNGRGHYNPFNGRGHYKVLWIMTLSVNSNNRHIIGHLPMAFCPLK